MVKYDDGWLFYNNRISYTETVNNSVVKTFTDKPSLYEDMVNKNPHMFSGFVNELIEPTEEQIKRLEEINKLKLEHPYSYEHIFQEYVESGYMAPTEDENLVKLYKKAKNSSKKELIKEILAILSSVKTEKEQGGITFEGMTVSTDTESQSKISSTLLGFMSGMITEVEFKFKNGFKTLDKEQFIKLAKATIDHVQYCFKAEMLCKEELDSKSVEDLDSLDELDEITEWFNNKYNELLNPPAEPKTEVKEEKKK